MYPMAQIPQADWVIEFETFSRKDNISAASLIASGLSRSILLQVGYVIGIKGGSNDGKTAIADFILFSLMDEKNPFTAPPDNKMFLEKRPGEGGEKTVRSVVSIFNMTVNVAFRNIYGLQKNRGYLKKKSSDLLHNGGLFFYSYQTKGKSTDQEMTSTNTSIMIETHGLDPNNIWRKKWKVTIHPRFRTPLMAMALGKLALSRSQTPLLLPRLTPFTNYP